MNSETTEIVTVIACLCLSAFFSLSETAFLASSTSLMHAKEKEGDTRAKRFNRIMRKPEKLISTLLLGNNVVNILASSVATALFVRRYGTALGVFYSTIAITVIVLLFCEIMPKTCAVKSPNQISLSVVRIISALIPLCNPIVVTMNAFIKGLLAMFGIKETQKTNEEKIAEIKGAIDLGLGSETEAKHEKHMLKSVLDLSEITVSDIMVHRKNVTSIDIDTKTEDIINFAYNCPYSRIPLYKDNPENIVGILHIKALAIAIEKANGNKNEIKIQDLATPPWFVLETTDLTSQLHDFQKRREHFAVVVDEYGAVLGIVTLEDLLEEIVGDIKDESDGSAPEPPKVKKQEDGSYIVDGSMPIRDLNREYDWNISDKDAATVSGFLIYETERIPDVGRTFIFDNFEYKIIEKKKNRITLVQIRPLKT